MHRTSETHTIETMIYYILLEDTPQESGLYPKRQRGVELALALISGVVTRLAIRSLMWSCFCTLLCLSWSKLNITFKVEQLS